MEGDLGLERDTLRRWRREAITAPAQDRTWLKRCDALCGALLDARARLARLENEASGSRVAGAYNSDEWWPEGLPEWIAEQVAAGDVLFVALDKGLRSFGWPAYNVPHPPPREDSWPGIALALAQRIREARSAQR